MKKHLIEVYLVSEHGDTFTYMEMVDDRSTVTENETRRDVEAYMNSNVSGHASIGKWKACSAKYVS